LSTQSKESTAALPGKEAPTTGVQSMLRVGASIVIGTVAWALPSPGTLGTVLPAQIALTAPHDKVYVLRVLTTAGSITPGAVRERGRCVAPGP
jgi:hypothetical protein